MVVFSYLAWVSEVAAQPRPPGGIGGAGGTGGTGAGPAPAPPVPTPSTGGVTGAGQISVPFTRGQYAGSMGYTRTAVRGRQLVAPINNTRMARMELRGGGRVQISTVGGPTPTVSEN